MLPLKLALAVLMNWSAVDAGELDAQMEALSGAVVEGFAPKPKETTKAVVKP